MKVLILGGNGFIGFDAARALAQAGHDVTALGRSVDAGSRRLPAIEWISADLARLQTREAWSERIAGFDAVVNCAGALQDSARDNLAAVQQQSMLALYAAASSAERPPLIVQVSANTGGARAGSAFLSTKRQADEALKVSGLRHVILRPALVIGRNAHGGTALVRALAAFPFVTPLFASSASVQTVSLDDVTSAILDAVEGRIRPGADIGLAHPEPATLARLVERHRSWLGLRPAPVINVPAMLARSVSRAADVAGRLGWRSPLRSTALTVMSGGVTAHLPEDEAVESDCQPGNGKPLHSLDETLSANPAGAQDLWFARLYLLKPVILLALSAFWIASGTIALARFGQSADLLSRTGLPSGWSGALTVATSVADIALGIAVLWRGFARTALTGMIALSIAYLAFASTLAPHLWLDPLGPLVKVIPSILLATVAIATLDER